MGVVIADTTNLKELVGLSVLLFPEESFDVMFDLYKNVLEKENELALLYEKGRMYAGYMHLSIRNDYVNGTNTSPVVFVEAVCVLPEYRKCGVGKTFVEYAELYAKRKGIIQIASDCFIDNSLSEIFHKSCGFVEKERVICFVKDV